LQVDLRPITRGDAEAMLSWHYDEPYSLYNPANGSLETMLDPANRYYSVLDDVGDVVGFCCFGPDARVPGGHYADETLLDVGLGMRPDLTGQGHGPVFFQAILHYAEREFAPAGLRVTVASFNRRALRVYEQAGFEESGRFVADDGGREFFQLVRSA